MGKENSFEKPLDAVKHAETVMRQMGVAYAVIAWGNRYAVKRFTVAQKLGFKVLEVLRPSSEVVL